ncbi:succinylglutamate-semialdehyde dehydrogenase [Altericroceibacterium xinjiangense]|uniref:succinylglutamate-semialdehyde dehydrogenase n=1 Tax=Altericroceibacterium xinjiangense TaxID=762261 RepID=UPI000F7E884A|nr:succinylglutamate-semialdehyde dehydrogenase [Altericroceibacterium xinjiangense]
MTTFQSTNPATGEVVWEGPGTGADECAALVARSRAAWQDWRRTALEDRIAITRRFAEILERDAESLAEDLARETGKVRRESLAEIGSMRGKVAISIAAQAERAGTRSEPTAFGQAVLRHRPHGVIAVYGPYNFPGHLPNGHIVPALLAGNCVVFKPSEEAPLIAERTRAAWREAGLPEDVLLLAQGGAETGAALAEQRIDGLFFTGSASVGAHLRRAMAERPDVILALELGGNNPLIAWDADPQAAASIAVNSAFVTTGQRCSCARRFIVPDDASGAAMIEATVALASDLKVGAWDEQPEPFMGPLISAKAADRALAQVEQLLARGAKPLKPFERISGRSAAFVTPAVLDVTGCDVPDEEIFAPVLQVRRVSDFDTALAVANDTRFGLAAGLVSADAALWDRFFDTVRAGVVNFNRPTAGASGAMPFGGIGDSGNHHPSAYYAADYCAYPVASLEAPKPGG